MIRYTSCSTKRTPSSPSALTSVELVKPWDYRKPLIWIADWHNHDPKIACELELVGNVVEILDAIGEAECDARA